VQTSTNKLELIDSTDQSLNNKAEEVTPDEIASSYIQGVIDRMLELSAGKGHSKHDSRQMVGLAAPQLGVNKRIISIDVTADGSLKEQTLHIFINPRIVDESDDTVPGREGCWSCDNICGNVARAREVTLEAQGRDGKPVTVKFSGFVARIAQHEVDHLDGIRFPDRIPADQPEKLHWVAAEEFAGYRLNWSTWQHTCPRDTWEMMKKGIHENRQ
jgi:peptide deformylase